MSVIYVDQLVIRLPSDVRNTFNPLYAFGGGGGKSSNRLSTPVMGLREVESGHVLLPMDEEGSIVVTPGQRYSIVLVRETRGDAAASVAAPPAAGGQASPTGNGVHNKAGSNVKEKGTTAAPARLQQQQQQHPVKQSSVPREVAVSVPVPQNVASQAKKERKASIQSTPSDKAHTGEALNVSPEEISDQTSRKRRRQDGNSVQVPHQEQQGRSKASPTANKSKGVADSDDVPLIDAYKSPHLYTSPRTSPMMRPSMSSESSRHPSKRGSPQSKAEEAALMTLPPLPPTRRSVSSSDGCGEEGSPSLVALYSVQPPAADPSSARGKEYALGGEEQTSDTSKKRRSPPKRTALAPANPAAPTKSRRSSPPLLHATHAEDESARRTSRQRSASSGKVPLTLPPSSRVGNVRRVPLDASSDSD